MFLTMVYKYPGPFDLGEDHGGSFATALARTEEELAALVAAGWHKTTAEAKVAACRVIAEEKAKLEGEVAEAETELRQYKGKQQHRKGSLL